MNVFQPLHYLFLGNGLSLWYIVRPWRDSRERRAIMRAYMQKQCCNYKADGCSGAPTVVCLFEGLSMAGGLADRLRGIVSVFAECQRHNLPFKLCFQHPFNLQYFLQPAQYDWRIDENQILRHPKHILLDVMRPLSDSAYTTQKQKQWLSRHFASYTGKHVAQIHLYTNASTAYDDDFQHLFKQLFQPSPCLQRSIDRVQASIGKPYISVSMRFLSLLGDFRDTVDAGASLTDDQRQKLVSQCLARIESLHRQYPSHVILVNSDSRTMLTASRQLPYVYTIEGNISHLDNCTDDADQYSKWEKTFLDFFSIAAADEVFLIKEHEKMRDSGFPYAAALVGGKQLKYI